LGEPEAVSVIAHDDVTRWQWENTRLYYPDASVVITGSWEETRGTPFVADYRAVFEKATLMRKDNDTILYVENEAPEALAPIAGDCYAGEIEYFVKSIVNDTPNTVNTPESACATVKLIEALRESAARDGEKIVYTLK
jgi:hypothetical protein